MTNVQNLLQYLEENYENIDHPLYLSSMSYIRKFFDGKLSIPVIENFLSGKYTYTIYRQPKKAKCVYYFIEHLSYSIIFVCNILLITNFILSFTILDPKTQPLYIIKDFSSKLI